MASVTIGVYRPFNPLLTLPAERIQALQGEAARQGAELYFFDAGDVDLPNKRIHAARPDADGRAKPGKTPMPFPDVVLNEWPVAPHERPEVEKELRKRVPFTTHLIHSKLEVQRMLEDTPYRDMLLPARSVESPEGVLTFLQEHQQLIVKPTHGRRGEAIFSLHLHHNGGIKLREDAREQELTTHHLEQTIAQRTEGKRLLMQLYWPHRTEQDEPVDYRAHVQRDHTGEWRLTKLYPRIGKTGSIISNLSRGGRTEEIDVWLAGQYGEERAPALKKRLSKAAIGLAECMNRSYSFLIDELGIDLLMNAEGDIRFLEANSGPETRYHEAERAIHAIGFARYLAEAASPRQSARTARTIGMLTPPNDRPEEKLQEACAYVAKSYDVEFYYFYAEDLTYFPFPFVKGYRMRQGQWQSRYLPYPDVIYDRLKARGKIKYKAAYSALEGIPSTEERRGGSFSKLKLYALLQTAPPILADHLIPFLAIEDPRAAIEFINRHGTVVIKPSGGSHGDQMAIVSKENRLFKIQDHEHTHRLEESQFAELLTAIATREGILAQKMIRSVTHGEKLPYHIRIHLVRAIDGGWTLIGCMPYISTNSAKAIVNHSSVLRVFTKWEWFLDTQYPGRQAEMDQRIRHFALELAHWLDRSLEERSTELGIDIGIDEEDHLWLYEANMNRVGANTRELELAKQIIPLALHLLHGAE
ncbi:YheC/YheD family protein [Paenibacillus koleovorans]|uniref:YheC/YheD family protein n=1 Tax=Paenibacillus koleovorans TaxID=121608 RepID=UPI000FD72B7B|nr:YheC/YheD family protein [Paenibacillus koleovorans]